MTAFQKRQKLLMGKTLIVRDGDGRDWQFDAEPGIGYSFEASQSGVLTVYLNSRSDEDLTKASYAPMRIISFAEWQRATYAPGSLGDGEKGPTESAPNLAQRVADHGRYLVDPK